jgi:hypothetical protein
MTLYWPAFYIGCLFAVAAFLLMLDEHFERPAPRRTMRRKHA